MGTLIANKGLKIKFNVDDEKIQQDDIEIYERVLGEYLTQSEYGTDSQAAIMSAIVFGAIEAKFIPENILTKENVLSSKPAKISFLAAEIAKIVDGVKNKEVNVKLEIPEITQLDLERYEGTRKKYIEGLKFSIYQIAQNNAIMVKIGLDIGLIPEDIVLHDDIPVSDPALIKYLADEMTIALSEARTISGE